MLLAGPTVRRIHREREMGVRQSVMAGGREERELTHPLAPAGARRPGSAVRCGRTPSRKKVAENVTFPLDTVTDKIARARELFVSGDNPGARECALLARAEMEATERAFGKCKKRIEDAERNIDKAGREGMDVSRMKNSVEAARQAMEEGSFKEAISKAQEANEQLKKDKKV